MSETVVYWLYDATCICPRLHGYVGISSRLQKRLIRHRTERKFPIFKFEILFRGTRDQCLALEQYLRPIWGIGWNKFAGGRAGGTAPKSSEHRAKMSAAAKARYSDPKERELARQLQIGKHDHHGENNPRFGAVLSEETKRKISEAHIGQMLGNQHWRKRKPFSPENLFKMSQGAKHRWENSRLTKEE